jgi:hypothetical protein
VYDMDAKFVNARRPSVAKPTEAHQEENLIPYTPVARSPPSLCSSLESLLQWLLGLLHLQVLRASSCWRVYSASTVRH